MLNVSFLFLTSVLPLCISPVLSLTFEHLSSIFFQFHNCVPYLCIPTATQFAKEMGFRVESPPSLFSSLHCPLSLSPSSPSLSLSFFPFIHFYLPPPTPNLSLSLKFLPFIHFSPVVEIIRILDLFSDMWVTHQLLVPMPTLQVG